MKRTIGRLSFLLAIATAAAMVGTSSAYALAAGEAWLQARAP